jgi:hypothetical protein
MEVTAEFAEEVAIVSEEAHKEGTVGEAWKMGVE